MKGWIGMHQAIVNIMLDRVKDQFFNEQLFCEQFLNVPVSEWDDWKLGKAALPTEYMQKLKSLFSDYEWMLIQKIARQTILFPEKRNYVVTEYKRLKAVIAKNWLKAGLAKVELITNQGSIDIIGPNQRDHITLRVISSYQEWGYDDILEFFLPGIVQEQIAEAKIDLLEWVDENLSDTYIIEVDED